MAVIGLVVTTLVVGATVPAAGAARTTKMSFNASPEPVKRGAKLTVTGQLKSGKKALKSKQIKIYFRAGSAGSAGNDGTYVLAGTATTNSQGRFSRKFTARTSGVWKAVYPGGSAYQPAIRYDAVEVRAVVPRRIAAHSGDGDWQGARIKIPTQDYAISWAYACTSDIAPFWTLAWRGDSYHYESLWRENLSGSGVFYGHEGGVSGWFDVGTQGDCQWTFHVYSGTTTARV